jgi:hypothetical protein
MLPQAILIPSDEYQTITALFRVGAPDEITERLTGVPPASARGCRLPSGKELR